MTTPIDPARVAALVPCHLSLPAPELLARIREHVGVVLVVADGFAPPPCDGSALLRLAARSGKGSAVAAGLRRLLASDPALQAVIVVDGDGQHPPEAIPRFIAAAVDAELVVGDRFGDLASMPPPRRVANRLTSRLLSAVAGAPVRDSQCGMRLLRGRALHEVGVPAGGYESETVHLKRCLRAGVRVAWVPLPAIYAGERSSFRAVRDGLRVLRACFT